MRIPANMRMFRIFAGIRIFVTYMEDGSLTINLIGVSIFLSLLGISATLAFFFGRVFFRRWYSWLLLCFYSFLGGLLSIGILYFGVQFERVRNDVEVESIGTMVVMIIVLFIITMTAWPVVGIVLRNRKERIRQLEEEIRKLKD
jgi:hypothetical protein